MATHHVWPANDTVSARLLSRRPSSQPPTSSAVRPLDDFGLGQRAEQSQQVGDGLRVTRRAILGEVLQLRGGGLAMTCGSSSSRSSTRPSSSASSMLSSDSAAARRSASGLSPSYMKAPT